MTESDRQPQASPSTLSTSFHAAREIMRTQAVSFYQAFKSLPPERFQAVTAVYAYCRYADDLVDEGGVGAIAMLDDLEWAVTELFREDHQLAQYGESPELVENDTQPQTSASKQPWWEAFVSSVRKYQVRKNDLLMQIAGQRMDAHFHDIRSIEELVQYARLVAGSVGRVLVPILVSDMGIIDNPDFMKSCEALGVGMQITNILRDVGEDIRERDRVYVPVELMRSHAITRVQLMQWSVAATDEVSTAKYRGLFLGGDKEYGDADPVAASPEIPQNFIDLWEELAAMADSYYLPYEAWISAFHHSARLPLVSAARLYQAIEQAVRDQHYDCFTQRCYTSAPIRSAIVQSVTQDLGRLLP